MTKQYVIIVDDDEPVTLYIYTELLPPDENDEAWHLSEREAEAFSDFIDTLLPDREYGCVFVFDHMASLTDSQ